jgi:hypothetical protein
MAVDALDHILEELSTLLKGKIKSNQNSTCMFKFDDVNVQIELEKRGEEVIIISQLGSAPTGKYREMLFQEALKHNGIGELSSGILAYSKQADTLILYRMLPLKETDGEKIFALLTPFCAKAKLWTDAISRGEIPSVSSAATAKGGTLGLFGFRP